MVMKKMREHTKTFLIILVLAFVGTIIFDWGMDVTGIRQQPNVMGKINGEKITADKYYQAVRNQVEMRRQQGTEDISDNEMSQIENQVWENMVQEILMRQEIHKRGIVVTDSEIVAVLKYNPPDILRSNQTFQTNGSFDMKKYNAALQDPRNDWRPVEDYVRTLIPFQKLQEQITASVIATPEEVRWEYVKRNEKAKVDYIFFNPNTIPDEHITINETEVAQYYNDHEEQYHEPEKRQIEYTIFPIKPTAQDSELVKEDARDLIKRIKAGEDFAELAKSYSEDPGSRDKGGDLGFFSKGQMVKPFEEAAFAAKAGEVVGPVKSSFGVHIIKVEEKKVENGEEKVHARHILLKYEASNQTRSDVETKARLFAMDAMEMGFQEAAKKDSLKVTTSPLFVEGGFIPGIGISRDINQFVFQNEVGTIHEEPFDTDQGLVVAKIISIEKEHTKPLEEVQTTIRTTLTHDKKKALAGKNAADVRSKMLLADDFQKIAQEDSLQIKETNLFSRNDYIPDVGNDPTFKGTAFGLQVNEISQPIETSRGYYLVKLIEKTPIDEADFERQKERLRQEILNRKRQQAFVDWYNNLKQKADIEDNRQKNA